MLFQNTKDTETYLSRRWQILSLKTSNLSPEQTATQAKLTSQVNIETRIACREPICHMLKECITDKSSWKSRFHSCILIITSHYLRLATRSWGCHKAWVEAQAHSECQLWHLGVIVNLIKSQNLSTPATYLVLAHIMAQKPQVCSLFRNITTLVPTWTRRECFSSTRA